MTKDEIISTYNGLTEELVKTGIEYRKVIGTCYPHYVHDGWLSTDSRKYSKYDLEDNLSRRQKHIKDMKAAISRKVNKDRLLSTEEGKKFFDGLVEMKEATENAIKTSADIIAKSFETVLAKAGMGDWAVIRPESMETFNGRYAHFDIEKTSDKNAVLTITIDYRNGWTMDVSSSLHCGGRKTIQDRDSQYHQFKGYITICDSCGIFQNWVETDYAAYCKSVDDLNRRLNDLENAIEDPMSEWIVSRVSEKMSE